MLRISFFTRQVSKRLVAELSAMNSVMGPADVKSKRRTSVKARDKSATTAAPAITAPLSTNVEAQTTTAAAGAVRERAEQALRVKPHGDILHNQDTSATVVTKKMKRKKKRAGMAVSHADTSATTTENVTSTNIVVKTSPLETKTDNDVNSRDYRLQGESQLVEKKKKKKLSRIHVSVRTTDQQGEEKAEDLSSVAYELPPPAVKIEVKQKSEKLTSAAAPSSSVLTVASSTTPPPPVIHHTKETSSQQKTPMIKAFRIEDVLAACTHSDGVFARRLPQGGCQFFAWPGTPLAIASNAVSTMPDTIRTVHAIFGREKTPIDLVLDIDCPVPQDQWSMSKVRPFQKKVLDDVLSVVVKEIEAIGEKIETQVVLQSPNLKKASFHVHTKLKDVAFEDYNSLHGFLYRFREKIPNVDLQIYRTNGMLRMHRCMKENHTSAIVLFDDKKWNIGFPNGDVSDSIAALHSACVREAGTYSRLLYFDVPRCSMVNEENRTKTGAFSAGGEGKIPCVLLPRTEQEAVESVSRWLRIGSRETDVSEWRTWIGLGINAYRVAYHFRDAHTLKRPAMEEILEAWVEASKKCPIKFRPGACESKWASFDINRLTKSQENDWWPSYTRIGRMAMMNEAADAVASSKTSGQK